MKPVGLPSIDDFSACSKTVEVHWCEHRRRTCSHFYTCREYRRPTGTPIVTPFETPAPTPTGERPLVQREVPHKVFEPVVTPPEMTALTPTEERPIQDELPQRILDPILKVAASLANVTREQLVIVRAQSVVWNDGSLGCPEPGQMYTQALVNGYWVVIEAAGQTYDFRVDHKGSFRLCPAGRGRPPRRPGAQPGKARAIVKVVEETAATRLRPLGSGPS